MEGPFFWQDHSGAASAAPYLYLFYSGSSTWGTTYAVGVARATSIYGPWTKMSASRNGDAEGGAQRHNNANNNNNNPLLHTRIGSNSTNTTFVSPGHNSITVDPVGGGTFIVYHASKWGKTGLNCIRYMMVDRLEWGSDGWPTLSTPDGSPSDGPLPVP